MFFPLFMNFTWNNQDTSQQTTTQKAAKIENVWTKKRRTEVYAEPLLRSEGWWDPLARFASTPGHRISATGAIASVPLATNGSDFVGSVVGVHPGGSMKMVPDKRDLDAVIDDL